MLEMNIYIATHIPEMFQICKCKMRYLIEEKQVNESKQKKNNKSKTILKLLLYTG